MSSKRTKSAKSRASRAASSPRSRHRYQRTDRVSVLVREIVASEIERIDDQRLAGVVITDVDVDRELTFAAVFFDVRNLQDQLEVEAAFKQHRPRIQRSLAAQVSMRRTPKLSFHMDTSVAAAERIDRILQETQKQATQPAPAASTAPPPSPSASPTAPAPPPAPSAAPSPPTPPASTAPPPAPSPPAPPADQ